MNSFGGERMRCSTLEKSTFAPDTITTAVMTARSPPHVNAALSAPAGTTGREKSRTPVKSWWWAQSSCYEGVRAELWDVTVVAAGENKDLQGSTGHRLREVRGSYYVILPSQDRKVTRFHRFLVLNSESTLKWRPISWLISHHPNFPFTLPESQLAF